MTTITFYSYKGGVGRSLALANVARLMSRFGLNVFAIDLDLEAPGLHYKFGLSHDRQRLKNHGGIVEYLHKFVVTGKLAESLGEYVVGLTPRPGEGSVWIMPAGDVPSAAYWQRLARINWHDLFYGDLPSGIPLFLELKESIRNEFDPDFLLIDARTGITELGGIATTVLPDKVVCLLIKNRENLVGAREVLRGIRRAPRPQYELPVEIIAVLTRLPSPTEKSERRIGSSVRRFLNRPAPELAATLNITRVLVFHSEPDLELSETLRVGGSKPVETSQLLRAYILLFHQLVPAEVVASRIASVVASAFRRASTDPKGTEEELKTLQTIHPQPVTFTALIQFYQRSWGPNGSERRYGTDDDVLRVATQMWEVTRSATDEFLLDVISNCFVLSSKRYREDWRLRDKKPPWSYQFVEAVWLAHGAQDVEIGLELAQALVEKEGLPVARRVLRRLMELRPPNEDAIVYHLTVLRGAREWREGLEIINQNMPSLGSSNTFLLARVRFLLEMDSKPEAESFLDLDVALAHRLAKVDPLVYARILATAGRSEELDSFLDSLLDSCLQRKDSDILEAGRFFAEAGRTAEFEDRVRQACGEERSRRILERTLVPPIWAG